MFKDLEQTARDQQVKRVMDTLSSHSLTKSHNRHLSAQGCIDIGLNVEWMESNQDLQDAILSVHHAAALTITNTNAIKLIENQEGKAYIQTAKIDVIPAR
jgi:hypothetical protein